MMADTNKAQDAEAKQQEPMPSSEDTPESTEAVGESQETSELPADSSESLPSEASERTKREFDKLQAELREVKGKNRIYEETLAKGQSKPSEPTPPVQDSSLYDPETGYVNIKALQEIEKKAQKVDEIEKRLDTEALTQKQASQEKEVKELYEAHPELNSEDKGFNQDLFNEAEQIYLHSLAYPEKYGGRQLSQKEAADLAKKRMDKPETDKEAAERLTPKEQASLEASGRPTQGVQGKVSSEENFEKLQVGTRLGEPNAMITRLKGILKK